MKKIAIIGTGGFGREVLEIILAINLIKPTYEFIGFYDDKIESENSTNGYPFLGLLSGINKIDYDLGIVLGVGDPITKKAIITSINNSNINYPKIVHPNAIIGKNDIGIGMGSVICAGSILTCNIKLEKFVTLNLACTVGHDTTIGEYSSFMPSVNISGEVEVSNQVFVGTGAKIINQLKIGEKTIIGAGAVVSKSLPSNCTAVGVPAKVIKLNE